MSILSTAASLFQQSLGGGDAAPSASAIETALSGLLPTSGSDIDMGSLVGKFTESGGLASLAASWLGDGGNLQLSPENIMQVFGGSGVSQFASALNLSEGQASSGLAAMIPSLIDQFSSGGSLKKNIAGSVISGLAGKLFGR
jgi:uncharacterized protein YidB (DUF937 family)